MISLPLLYSTKISCNNMDNVNKIDRFEKRFTNYENMILDDTEETFSFQYPQYEEKPFFETKYKTYIFSVEFKNSVVNINDLRIECDIGKSGYQNIRAVWLVFGREHFGLGYIDKKGRVRFRKRDLYISSDLIQKTELYVVLYALPTCVNKFSAKVPIVKKAKNKKVNLGGSYRREIAKKYKKPKTRGDKNANRRRKK